MATAASQYEQTSPGVKLLLALIIMGGTYYWYSEEIIAPKKELIAEKKRQLEDITSEINTLNKNLESPISLDEEVSRANREFRKVLELLPGEPAVEKVLNEFASLSRITGSEIREFIPMIATDTQQGGSAATNQGSGSTNSLSPVPSTEDATSQIIEMKMQGTFTSIVSFLDLSMSVPRMIRLLDFEISNPDKELKLIQRPRLAFSGKFAAFYQKSVLKNEKLEDVSKDEQTKNAADKNKVGKPLIDLNEVIDKSFSAKGQPGGEQ